ncbi:MULTISPECIES: phage tail tube protein [Sulfitobacter]|uniref:Phage tail tube protein n=1 Tax=Sulfitobacter profundi TaxID=2679961 RepID=A0ABW1YUJ7_9RHOB|nr:phage tail tube protein [Sulfitobacter indolifex]
MAKQKGRAMLLKISDGEAIPVFTPFAGLTSKSLQINNERIDVTTPDPVTPEGEMWRETLDGVKSVSVSGDGQLVEGANEARLVTIAMSAAAEDDFQVVVPGLGAFAGRFAVNVEYTGAEDMTFSITLQSTGKITFTAAV